MEGMYIADFGNQGVTSAFGVCGIYLFEAVGIEVFVLASVVIPVDSADYLGFQTIIVVEVVSEEEVKGGGV